MITATSVLFGSDKKSPKSKSTYPQLVWKPTQLVLAALPDSYSARIARTIPNIWWLALLPQKRLFYPGSKTNIQHPAPPLAGGAG